MPKDRHAEKETRNLTVGYVTIPRDYYTYDRVAQICLCGKWLESPSGDINLEDLNYSFITGFEGFEYYIRNNPLKAEDPCTNNATMKHLERLKNELIEKNPFTAYKLKVKLHEMEFEHEDELAKVETAPPQSKIS